MKTLSKFFVLGLPRSRTYWLSIFLECTHEGLYYCPNYEDFINMEDGIFAGMSRIVRGDSTTCYNQIKDFIPGDSKIVIIHRNVLDVAMSIDKIFIKSDMNMLKELSEELNDVKGLHINFDDINDRLEEIWNYVRVEPFDEERANKMKNIILNNEIIIDEARAQQEIIMKNQKKETMEQITSKVQPQAQDTQEVSLTLQDITMVSQVIDIAAKRGAFVAADMEVIGGLFNRINAFIKAATPAEEQTEEKAALEGDE